MALISCSECGKSVSEKAKTCPHCGYEISSGSHFSAAEPAFSQASSVENKKSLSVKKKKKFWTYLLIAFILMVVIGVSPPFFIFLSVLTLILCAVYAVNSDFRSKVDNLAIPSFVPESVKSLKQVALWAGITLFLSYAVINGKEKARDDQARRAAQQNSATQAQEPTEPVQPKSTPEAIAEEKHDSTPIVGNVTASQVLKDYDNNKISAEQKYKGKRFSITGFVNAIGENFGQMYITLGTGSQFEVISIQCFFDEKYKTKLASLKKDQKVTIKGTVSDYVMNITAKDCEF